MIEFGSDAPLTPLEHRAISRFERKQTEVLSDYSMFKSQLVEQIKAAREEKRDYSVFKLGC